MPRAAIPLAALPDRQCRRCSKTYRPRTKTTDTVGPCATPKTSTTRPQPSATPKLATPDGAGPSESVCTAKAPFCRRCARPTPAPRSAAKSARRPCDEHDTSDVEASRISASAQSATRSLSPTLCTAGRSHALSTVVQSTTADGVCSIDRASRPTAILRPPRPSMPKTGRATRVAKSSAWCSLQRPSARSAQGRSLQTGRP